ncbi:hypothetical protein Taro_055572, partial [Colocasia esculenta]|nr:hypothetical protein [Colocasia esculenta]
ESIREYKKFKRGQNAKTQFRFLVPTDLPKCQVQGAGGLRRKAAARPLKAVRRRVGNLLHKLRYGSKTPSLLKGFSTAEVHRLVAGILGVGIGVAGLLLALRNGNIPYLQVPWTTDERASSRVVYTVAGLHNLGNNCFLNVILQALASCGCFRSFLQNVLDADDLETEERAKKMPLTVTLVTLLEGLCVVREERVVLSPRRVMLEMEPYVSDFNLKRQQDAAEAFLLLLSSLEEEVSQCYVPNHGSLVDVSDSPSWVTASRVFKERRSECKRWQQWFFGKFGGIVGSILTCKSCSSQLSVDFEFFRCLPITPVLDKDSVKNDVCNLEGCLKHFVKAENLENYRCDRCSHIIALKYLCLKPEENEVKIKTLSQCVKFDSCDCKSIFLQDGLVWPTRFSCVSKRLIIARCPKILCIQLQRASMNKSGEIVKIEACLFLTRTCDANIFHGHISFPLVLDLFPFSVAANEILLKSSGESILKQVEQQESSTIYLNNLSMPWQLQLLPMRSFMREGFSGEAHIGDKPGTSIHVPSDDTSGAYNTDILFEGKNNYANHCSEASCLSTCQRSNEKVNASHSSAPSTSYSYSLTSVVEHYGGSGGGHYAVYRKVMLEQDCEDSMAQLQTADHRWVYASDHEVSEVSEDMVFRAEASLLFYERVDLVT